jgi:50S ribosomal protein L16 3-hydroxylase
MQNLLFLSAEKSPMKNPLSLLGNLSPQVFLRDYWQKKPLLIRQAIPHFQGLLTPKQLIDLACDDEAQARLVTQKRGKWQLQSAPFEPNDFTALGQSKWTVLVQGVNHFLPAAAALLQQFSFIPHARLDDLMISYAPKGGGVGAHFDSYDVFLLQGTGLRRWQISAQADQTLVDGAPLRILHNFQPEQEWVLAPGDMLYLPPHYAHHGIAEDDCMTYSIGFRAPAYQELAEQFLVYLQDRICVEGQVADPDLKLQAHPAEISDALLKQVANAIRQVRWDNDDIANFLGSYLSEPKAHIFFDAPENPLSLPRFTQAAQKNGITLHLKTQLLCRQQTIFINGEAHPVNTEDYPIWRELANTRHLPAQFPASPTLTALLHQCHGDGYLEIPQTI